MRSLVTICAVLFLAGNVRAVDNFCLTVSDACCNVTESSSSSYTVVNSVQTIYFHYDTGSLDDAVRIRLTVDGVEVFNEIRCGCGNITCNYLIGPGHVIVVYARCGGCESDCASSTARVWARSGTITCSPACGGGNPGE